tara:strand:+ start:17043 stop:18401 length:1359 start_codon:yes stop_codon:yes gene_type:complete
VRPAVIDLQEWKSVGPGDETQGGSLAGFRFEGEDQRQIAQAFTKKRVVEFHELYDGLQIRARSHVGRIQIGALTLTIRPKVASEQLLSLFRYAYGLDDVKRYESVDYTMGGGLFQDLVIAQLGVEAKNLIERGVTKSYIGKAEQLSSPRGTIDFARLGAQGGIVSATLPCRHYPRSSDNLLNQVVLAGLRLAGDLAQDRSLAASVRRLGRTFAEFATPIQLSASVLEESERAINRLVRPYRSVVRLIELLYQGSLVNFDGQHEARRLPGFLFDMNRFFQTLLERFLIENLRAFDVEPEHGLSEMMRFVPGHNPSKRKAPRPRPDYAVKQGRNVLALLDAKYRDLWEKPLPRDMLYQLSIYALSQPKGSTAAILYPSDKPEARPSLIEIREPMSGEVSGYVAQRPVNLTRLVELVGLTGSHGEAARESYALFLSGLASPGRPNSTSGGFALGA